METQSNVSTVCGILIHSNPVQSSAKLQSKNLTPLLTLVLLTILCFARSIAILILRTDLLARRQRLRGRATHACFRMRFHFILLTCWTCVTGHLEHTAPLHLWTTAYGYNKALAAVGQRHLFSIVSFTMMFCYCQTGEQRETMHTSGRCIQIRPMRPCAPLWPLTVSY